MMHIVLSFKSLLMKRGERGQREPPIKILISNVVLQRLEE